MKFLSLLIAGHFLYHLIATIGVMYSLIHSQHAHNKRWWKLPLAVLWFVLSIVLLVGEVNHRTADHECHEERHEISH